MNFICIGVLIVFFSFVGFAVDSTNILASSLQSQASLKVTLLESPEVLRRHAKARVEWSGIQNPTFNDVISVFGCEKQNCARIRPNDRLFETIPVTLSPTWMNGSGSIEIDVWNIHLEFVLQYIQNPKVEIYTHASQTLKTIFKSGSVVARSNSIKFDPLYPVHGRITLANPSGYDMRVQFTLMEKRSDAYVLFGEDEKMGTKVPVKTITTYGPEHMSAPANLTIGLQHWHPVGYFYDVVLEGLKPDTKYFYQFGIDGHLGEQLSFKTKPRDGDRRPMSYVTYGDMGIGSLQGEDANWVQSQISKRMQSGQQEFVLHFGDISYARSSSLEWKLFMTQIETFAGHAPYFVSEGNHEYCYHGQPFKPDWSNYGSDSDGERSVPYNSRFHMPHDGKMERNLWYSFNWGMVHFLVYSGERDFMEGSAQREWMEADLREVNRTLTPWVIVSTHRPLYQSGADKGDRGFTNHYTGIMEPLFIKYGVDVVMTGHMHFQERTCQMKYGECVGEPGVYDGSAPVHFVIGSACCLEDFAYPQPKWSLYRAQTKGYSTVSVHSEKKLTVDIFESRRGDLVDTITIDKK